MRFKLGIIFFVLIAFMFSTKVAYSQKVKISLSGNDGSANANILGVGNPFGLPAGSTHPNFPYLTWQGAYGRVVGNNLPNQTIEFCPGLYTNQSSQGNIDVWDLNNLTSLKGLTIDGAGAYLSVAGAGIGFLWNRNVDSITVKNFTFRGFNNSGPGGSCITMEDALGSKIDNCIFYGNPTETPVNIESTQASPNGNVSAVISNSTFAGNPFSSASTSTVPNSGALKIEGYEFSTMNVDILNVSFSCNGRQGVGGAILINGSTTATQGQNCTVNVDGCDFYNNNMASGGSGNGGGAIFSSNRTTLNITNSDFCENTVDVDISSGGGGAIYAFATTLTVDNCSFANNECSGVGVASTDGGAIFIDGGTSGANQKAAVISNSFFYGNKTPDDGGAIRVRTATSFIAKRCVFFGNTGSGDGGGISDANGSTVTIDSCTFYNNSGGVGSAVSSNGSGTIDIKNSILFGNPGTQTNAPLGIGNFTTNPSFVNIGTGPGANFNATATNAGASLGVVPSTTCATSCPAFVFSAVCESSPSDLTLACAYFCSTVDSLTDPNPVGENVSLDVHINNFVKPTCTNPLSYSFVFLIVDGSGNVVGSIPATDSNGDGLPDASLPGATQTLNLIALNLPPGNYSVVGFHYLTTDVPINIPSPFVGNPLAEIVDSVTIGQGCGSIGNETVFKVLKLILVNITTSCTNSGGAPAGNGTFFANISITGGWPEENNGGSYTLVSSGFDAPISSYAFGSSITDIPVTFVNGGILNIRVTNDGNSTNLTCNSCTSLNFATPHLCCSDLDTIVNKTSCNPADTGTVIVTLVSVGGCDSIVTTITTLLPSYNIAINETTCIPANAGTVVQNLKSIDGCDSIVTTITTLLPSYNIAINETTCIPANAGTVVQNLKSIDGCDSIVTTITTLLTSYNITINETTCIPANAGTVVQNLKSIDGCDSIVTTITTLLTSYNITINETTCIPANAGTVVQNLKSIEGCDSIVTTITTLLTSYNITINETTCIPANAGTVVQNLKSIEGCDSIVTTITTLLTSYNITINETTCIPANAGVSSPKNKTV